MCLLLFLVSFYAITALCDVLSFVYVIFIAHMILPWYGHSTGIVFCFILFDIWASFVQHIPNEHECGVVWYGMVWCGMAVAACVSVCMYVWLAQQYVLIHSLLRACFLLVPPPPLLLLFVSIIHLIFRFCTAVRADDFVYATSHIYACKTIAVRTGANKRFFIK